eukprot:gene51601-69048_t
MIIRWFSRCCAITSAIHSALTPRPAMAARCASTLAPSGACECGTCHVRVSADWVGKLYPPTEEEEERLDTLPLVFPDSHLACQILWTEALDGLEVTLATFDD